LVWLVSASVLRADINDLQKSFQQPPDDARIMVRWWWYGPAVTHDGIDRELAAMKMGNVGGFEVQPTYPLVVDGTGPDAAKNLKFMSPEFLEMLGHTAAKSKELGLRMDLTLGSGWPYGGPMFSAADGAKALTSEVVQVAAGEHRPAILAVGADGVGAVAAAISAISAHTRKSLSKMAWRRCPLISTVDKSSSSPTGRTSWPSNARHTARMAR
jgi:alpha-L-rhamnosidase